MGGRSRLELKRPWRLFFRILFLVGLVPGLQAAHFTADWVSPNQSDEWTNAANWSIGVVPGNQNGDTYDVVIDEHTQGFHQVNLIRDLEISRLTLDNTLNVGFGGQGFSLQIRDEFHWRGGFLSGWGSRFDAHGNVFFEGQGTKTLERQCELYLHTNSWWTGGDLNFTGSGKVTIYPEAHFWVQTGGTIGDPVNSASADFFNLGDVSVNAPGSEVAVFTPFHNDGTLEIDQGAMRFLNRFLGGGVVRVNTNAHLIFSGSYVALGSAPFINLGTIELRSFNPIELTEPVTLGGRWILANGISGAGDMTVDHLDWESGDLQGTGMVSIPTNGIFRVKTSALVSRSIENHGQVTFDPAMQINSNGGELLNVEEGVVTLADQAAVLVGLKNRGVVIKPDDGSSATISGPLTNSGIFQIGAGSLDLAGGGESSGVFQVSTQAVFLLSGNHSFNANSKIQGEGIIRIISNGEGVNLAGDIGSGLYFDMLGSVRLTRQAGYILKQLSLGGVPGRMAFLGSDFTNEVTGDLAIVNCYLQGRGMLRSSGLLSIGLTTNYDAGKLFLKSGMRLENRGDGRWLRGGIDVSDAGSELANRGTLTVSTNSSLVINPGGSFSNSNAVEFDPSLKSLALNLNPFQTTLTASTHGASPESFFVRGPVTLAAGSLNLQQGSSLLVGDVISTNSTQQVTSATLKVANQFVAGNSQIHLSDGQIDLAQPGLLIGSTISGSGVVSGSLDLTNKSRLSLDALGSELLVQGDVRLLSSNCVTSVRLETIGGNATNSSLRAIGSITLGGRFDLDWRLGSLTIGPNSSPPLTVVRASQPLTGSFANAPSGGLVVSTNGLIMFRLLYGTNSPFGADRVVLVEAGSPYELWRVGSFSSTELSQSEISGPLADPDLNGYSNLEEFALALEHGQSVTGSNPRITRPKGMPYFDVVLQQREALGAITLTPGFSTDLRTWSDYSTGPTFPVSLLGVTTTNGIVTRTFRYSLTSPRLFVRTRITLP